MLKVFFLVAVCLSVVVIPACSNISSADSNAISVASSPEFSATPEPTKPPIDPELLSAQPAELCNRLAEIKKLPYRDPNDTDAIYEALIAKGEKAYPCLIEKITDETKMRDPREAPIWPQYAVGDTAVFILARLVRSNESVQGELLQEMLPPPHREEWETNGVYAYFNYVIEPKNRKELQRWWKERISRNKK